MEVVEVVMEILLMQLVDASVMVLVCIYRFAHKCTHVHMYALCTVLLLASVMVLVLASVKVL